MMCKHKQIIKLSMKEHKIENNLKKEQFKEFRKKEDAVFKEH